MHIRIIIKVLVLLNICSCLQQSVKNGQQVNSDPVASAEPASGLLIHNNIQRGISYTDSLGYTYNLRYIPITLTNDTTVSIQFQIDFANLYEYSPDPTITEQFKLMPLPTKWALDAVGVTDSMLAELPHHIDKPIFKATVEPGKQLLFAVGALYDKNPECGIIPRALFTQSESHIFQDCESRLYQDQSVESHLALGVQLHYCHSGCLLISCGQYSYSE